MVEVLPPKEVDYALKRAIETVYLKKIKQNTPSKTGKTAAAWKLKKVKDGEYMIYNKKFGDIVEYLENGTGLYGPKGEKYIIVPKDKKALKFIINGKTVFCKEVVHPGIEARHFIRDTMEDSITKRDFFNEFDKRFHNILDRNIARVCKKKT